MLTWFIRQSIFIYTEANHLADKLLICIIDINRS